MLWFKKDKGSPGTKMPIWLLIIGGVLGIVLILFGSRNSSDSKATDSEKNSTPVKEDEIVRYQDYLETRIEELCASVGLGEVSAIVTLDGGFEDHYATEQKGENETYVIIGSGSSAQPLLLSRTVPSIMGIGVVCPSPLSPVEQNEILSLLSATFHTPSNRICIIGRS
jgi:hypothetical protein